MAFDPNDKNTWIVSTLNTPQGPVTYWVLAEFEGYSERNQTDGNAASVFIAVAWHDRILWKRYALGTVKQVSNGYLDRWPPMAWPLSDGKELYLTGVDKVKIHLGLDSTGKPKFVQTDAQRQNWFDLPAESSRMPPRIVYRCTFTNLPYKVVDQTTFNTTGSQNEQRRHLIREWQARPVERRRPDAGYERTDTGLTVLEVGFTPFIYYEFTWTWVGIPEDAVPWAAIENCTLKTNNATFGYKKDGTYGKYRIGDILFAGLAGKLKPYRGPNHEWLFDMPYIFRWQPADGTGYGHRKIPLNGGTWVTIRERGSSASPIYLYGEANLDTLFQPEPL